MSLSVAIAKRIKSLLKEKQMSQYRLEQNTNILHSTMSNIMNAKNQSINLKTLMQICQGLKLNLTQFFDDPIFELENFELE